MSSVDKSRHADSGSIHEMTAGEVDFVVASRKEVASEGHVSPP